MRSHAVHIHTPIFVSIIRPSHTHTLSIYIYINAYTNLGLIDLGGRQRHPTPVTLPTITITTTIPTTVDSVGDKRVALGGAGGGGSLSPHQDALDLVLEAVSLQVVHLQKLQNKQYK